MSFNKKIVRISIVVTEKGNGDFLLQKTTLNSEASVQRLMGRLSVPHDQLPLDTEMFVREMGEQCATELVVRLVSEGKTGGMFFAMAAALVRFSSLPLETQGWFREKGIFLLDEENIVVHLRHRNDERARACHELGCIIGGTPDDVYDIDTSQQPSCVSRDGFTPHEVDEKHPNGCLAEVNVWGDRLKFTVAGTYVAGGGPNARGIIVPAGKLPVVYIHTKNSFDLGSKRGERNFYLKQGGMDRIAWYSLMALGMHLEGKIPAK
ncbi:MAG: hypothetical protein ABID04_02825 [Patescibacteria group bacterium]